MGGILVMRVGWFEMGQLIPLYGLWMKLKISDSVFWCHTQNWLQLELFTDPKISLNFLTFLKKIYLNSTQTIPKFTS